MWCRVIFLLTLQLFIRTKESCAQSEVLQAKILAYIASENKGSRGATFLSKTVTSSLFGQKSVSKENELREVGSLEILNSLDSVCKEKAKLFEWDIHNPTFFLLSADSFNKQFDYDSQKIVEIKCRLFKRKKVIKEANASNTYITTSPIVTFKNFALIYVRSVRGLTLGSSCLYVFETDEKQNIELKKKAYCYTH